MASRASEKMNRDKSPSSSRCWPSYQQPLLHASVGALNLLCYVLGCVVPRRRPCGMAIMVVDLIKLAGGSPSFWNPPDYLSCCNALWCCPLAGGTLPSGHVGRYSSCHLSESRSNSVSGCRRRAHPPRAASGSRARRPSWQCPGQSLLHEPHSRRPAAALAQWEVFALEAALVAGFRVGA